MRSRIALLAFMVCGALLGSGCEAECYVVDPLPKVRKELREQVDDTLDEADVSDEQRAKIQKLFAATVRARQTMRDESLPRQREIMAELRRDVPDRARLTELLNKNIDAGERYGHAVVDAILQTHALLTPSQRKTLAANAQKPSEAFEGSWLLDRAIDYFVSRIDATAEQRDLVQRIKLHLIKSGRSLQRQTDALRAEGAREFAKDVPNVAVMHATVLRGRGFVRQTFYNVTGYYLLLSSKLDTRQRALLNAELVRFEPCPTSTPTPQRVAALDRID
jgi:Spy/CpxP family protein refolding chaperone